MSDFELTDTKTRMMLLSQEQTAQVKSLGELRLALTALLQEMKGLEKRLDVIERVRKR